MPMLLVERLPLVTYMVPFGEPSPVAYVSPQFERLFGWTPEECLARTDFWESQMHRDDRPRFLAAWAHIRKTREPLAVEYRVTTRAGVELWVRDVGEVGRGEDGELYVHGYLADITREKKLERELADERAQAEAFFRDSPAGLGITDAEGRFVRLNEALARINGATVDEHLGRTLDEIAPEISEAVDPLLGQVKSTGVSLGQHELMIDRADGQRLHVAGSIFPIEAGGGTQYGRIVVDVTEQRRAEEKGADAERQYRRLIEQLPLVTYADALAPEARTTYISPQIEALFGYPPHRFLEDYALWYRIIHPDDVEHVLQVEAAARDSGEPFELEYRAVRPDGTVVWVLDLMETVYENGTPVFQQGFLIDITERKENERLFRAVFDNAFEAMLIVDNDARNVDVNPAACELFGRSHDELLGERFRDLSDSSELGGVFEEFLAAGSAEGSFTFAHPDGAVREVEYAARTNVHPGRHLAVLRDVTERKHLELELWRAQRLESVGRLAGGVAHDFNNVLTAIRGYAQLLLARTIPGTVEHHHAQEIDRAADRAAALTAQLLAFGRRQVLQPRSVDLNRLVTDRSGSLSQLAGAAVGLELDPSLSAVRVDPEQIEQVLVNLVANAAQAAPEGGRIVIRTVNADLTHGDVGDLPAGRYAVLSVEDSGPGLDETTRDHLFEPFFTTKDIGQGVGLGLATAYGIARQSGGTIEVTSEPGAGATFSVFLPEESAAAEDALPSRAA
jgi:PAS domain S-box-containing protein